MFPIAFVAACLPLAFPDGALTDVEAGIAFADLALEALEVAAEGGVVVAVVVASFAAAPRNERRGGAASVIPSPVGDAGVGDRSISGSGFLVLG